MPDSKFTRLTKESPFTIFASFLWCLDIMFLFFWETKNRTSDGLVCHLLRERYLTEVTVQTVQSFHIGPYSWRCSYYWHIFLWEQITSRVWRSCGVAFTLWSIVAFIWSESSFCVMAVVGKVPRTGQFLRLSLIRLSRWMVKRKAEWVGVRL